MTKANSKTTDQIKAGAIKECIQRIKNYRDSAVERAKEDDADLITMISETATAKVLTELMDSFSEDLIGI